MKKSIYHLDNETRPKTILITGAYEGLGYKTAETLLSPEYNYNVILTT